MRWGRRDESGLGSRLLGEERDRARPPDGAITSARPLLRPAPRSATFFPLVVIVAVLPGLCALTSWDLTPPGPWWGLRGLAVLDGHVLDQMPAAEQLKPALEARAFRAVASQPPLYPWLESVGLALSADHNPLASVLPSYAAGALIVVLVYLHGRLWRGPGLGLFAAVLTGFNPHLLLQMQQAAPTTLALAGALGALLCYGEHLRLTAASASSELWRWGGPIFWAVLGGLCLGLSLLSVGVFGLVALPVVLLHQVYLRASSPPAERTTRGWGWWTEPLMNPSIAAGVLTLVVALAVAAPWHIWMAEIHGKEAVDSWFRSVDLPQADRPGLLGRLVRLAPTALPLGLFAAARAVRLALADDSDDRAIVGGVFWVLWLAVAALVPAFWPLGPSHLASLFLLIPLNLLAASAVSDLATRKVPVRTLNWLAPATALTVVWCLSDNLSNAVHDLINGRANAATALGLHLALDILVVAILAHTQTRSLGEGARDGRQRRVLGGFLLSVTILSIAAGCREVLFRHQETDDLLMLRTMILWRNRERPFTLVAVVGPEVFRQSTESGPGPGGRLRFILRTALPHLPQIDLEKSEDLLTLPDPEGQRLVIIAGSDQRLLYAVQSRLGLEAIHPGRMGVLDAFATANTIVKGRPGRPRTLSATSP